LSEAAQAARRIIARCRELAQVSDVPGQTTRLFLSPATREAHVLVGGWIREAGLKLRIDAIGNLRGLLGSEDLPRLVIGSHLDTVIDSGAFDGPLGVMLGIELAHASAHDHLPFAIEVIGFSEEEGVRFAKPFLGSLAATGELSENILGLRDAEGVTLRQAVAEFGLDITLLPEAHLSESAVAYLEFHIEQGPVLDSDGEPVAVVQAIAGQSRIQVSFHGHSNHAGTTPMGRLRRDALAAASEWVTEVERYASGCEGLVATVANLEVPGGAANVIAGRCFATLDVRHAEDAVRLQAVESITAAARQAGERRRVAVEFKTSLDQTAVPMDTVLADNLAAACARFTGKPARRITSGAGHDAMILAGRLPPAMLFLRSPGGVSHHPTESVNVSDVEAAYGAGLEFLRSLRDDRAMFDLLVKRASNHRREAQNA